MATCTRKLRSNVKSCSPVEMAIHYIRLQKDPDHAFAVQVFENKGRGVVAIRCFSRGDFILQYYGDIISEQEGEDRERKHSSGYRFFFTFKGVKMCIDATEEPQKNPPEKPWRGRLVNHGSRKEINAKMKVIDVDGSPCMGLFAIKPIKYCDEILYDYGVTSLPWEINKTKHDGKPRGAEGDAARDTENADSAEVVTLDQLHYQLKKTSLENPNPQGNCTSSSRGTGHSGNSTEETPETSDQAETTDNNQTQDTLQENEQEDIGVIQSTIQQVEEPVNGSEKEEAGTSKAKVDDKDKVTPTEKAEKSETELVQESVEAKSKDIASPEIEQTEEGEDSPEVVQQGEEPSEKVEAQKPEDKAVKSDNLEQDKVQDSADPPQDHIQDQCEESDDPQILEEYDQDTTGDTEIIESKEQDTTEVEPKVESNPPVEPEPEVQPVQETEGEPGADVVVDSKPDFEIQTEAVVNPEIEEPKGEPAEATEKPAEAPVNKAVPEEATTKETIAVEAPRAETPAEQNIAEEKPTEVFSEETPAEEITSEETPEEAAPGERKELDYTGEEKPESEPTPEETTESEKEELTEKSEEASEKEGVEIEESSQKETVQTEEEIVASETLPEESTTPVVEPSVEFIVSELGKADKSDDDLPGDLPVLLQKRDSPAVFKIFKENNDSFSIVCSGLDKSEKNKVLKLAKIKKWTVCQRFNASTTHVIVKADENLSCSQTLKFFQGIARRIWVVSFSWVEEFSKSGFAEAEDDFEIQGDGGPKKARTYADSTPFMSNYEIAYIGPYMYHTEDEWRCLVEQCGAKWVSNASLFSSESNTYILQAETEKRLEQEEYNDIHRKYEVPVVSRSWFFDSIAAYTVKPILNYQLSDIVSNIVDDTDDTEAGYPSPTFEVPVQEVNKTRMEEKLPRKGRPKERHKGRNQHPRESNSSDRRDPRSKHFSRKRTHEGNSSDRRDLDDSILHMRRKRHKSNSSDRRREWDSSNDSIKSEPSGFPNIHVPKYEAPTGKRNYGKLHSCYICRKLIVKIPRHLVGQHYDNVEIARALAMKKEEKEKELDRLRLLGDFNHNLEVYEKGEGEYLVLRKSHKKKRAEDYLPCLHCYGFVEVKELWRHVKLCKYNDGKKTESPDKGIVEQCRMLIEGANVYRKTQYTEVTEHVVNRMHEGNIKEIIKNDDTILQYGQVEYERKGSGKRHYIAQKMRYLGRLVEKVNKMLPEKQHGRKTLNDLISHKGFDHIIKATESLSKPAGTLTMNGVKMSKTPSIGLHLGHALVKVSMLKRGRAIRLQDDKMKKEALDFKELHEAEWTSSISSPALQTLKEKRFFRKDVTPLTSDIQKLMKYCSQQIKKLHDNLLETPNESSWRALAKAMYVVVLLFNRRRGGELAKMHLKCYENRNHGEDTTNEDILDSLSPLEKQLLTRFEVINLPGKRDRKVPLLVKDSWVQMMQQLVEKRHMCGVKETNPYFFAVVRRNGHINAWQTLNSYAIKAGCKKPEDVSTTRIRKYTATVVQILSLQEGELEWLSNHMGHDLNVHRDVYRLHEDTIEIAKISKLLLIMEEGNIGQFKGKSLEEINTVDVPITEDSEDSEDSEGEEGTGTIGDSLHSSNSENVKQKQKNAKMNLSTDSSGSSTDAACADDSESDTKKRKRLSVKKNGIIDSSGSSTDAACADDSESDTEVMNFKQKRKRFSVKKKTGIIDSSGSSTDAACSDDSESDEVMNFKQKRKRFSVKKSGIIGDKAKPHKNLKRRWNEGELQLFDVHMQAYIKKKIMPSGKTIDRLVKALNGSRTKAQIRTRVNNIIKGKQKTF